MKEKDHCGTSLTAVDGVSGVVHTPREVREGVLREAQIAIREACGMCDGHGYTIETRYVDGHNCDGTEESCQASCPVPIPSDEQVACEYCGRPIAAIEKLIASAAQKASGENA